MTNKTKRAAVDFAERTTATAVQAGLAILIAQQAFDHETLKVAGLAAALAAGKFVYGKVNAWQAKEDNA